jgi:hypothetical protein
MFQIRPFEQTDWGSTWRIFEPVFCAGKTYAFSPDITEREAISRNFRAMQYNLVVSTNDGAVRLWKKLGFSVIGTLSEAFRHPRLGFVDAFIMYKRLR